MKIIKLNLNILIIAIILTINTPDLIFAQNNSSHQKPKSTTTRYQNLYDNSSSSTVSEASNRHYNRNTKSNDNFLDEYRKNKYSREDDYYTDRYERREQYTNNDKFDNRYNKNEEKNHNEGYEDKYSSEETRTENYFHIDRTGRTLWDGKHWKITDFPLKIYVKESSSRYYKSVYKNYVKYAPASKKASEYGPDLSETHHTRAFIASMYERDYEAAEKEYKRALEINPTNSQARIWYGLFYLLFIRNDVTGGLEQHKLAIENDPLSDYLHSCYAVGLIYSDRFKQAITAARKLEPDSTLSHGTLGLCLLSLGKVDDALDEIEISCKMSNRTQFILIMLFLAYTKKGQQQQAAEIYKEMENFPDKSIQPTLHAIAAAILNEKERALELIRYSIKIHDPNFPIMLSMFKESKALTNIPEFKEIIKQAGIPQNEVWFKT